MKFLEEHCTNDWTALNVHGGEPTISPFLSDVLHRARTLGVNWTILQTNAMRFRDIGFASDINAAGVDLYTVGFHGSSGKIMDSITGVVGAFDRALQGIRVISRFNKAIRFTIVVCALNHHDLSGLVSLAASEGVSHINISAMQPGGSAANDLEALLIPYSVASANIIEAVGLAITLGLNVTLEGFPYCALKSQEAYQVDWAKQCLKVLYRDIIIEDFNKFLTATIRSYGPPCVHCTKREDCSGVYKEYINRYGWSEFHSYESE